MEPMGIVTRYRPNQFQRLRPRTNGGLGGARGILMALLGSRVLDLGFRI